jgi:hypothetical protein
MVCIGIGADHDRRLRSRVHPEEVQREASGQVGQSQTYDLLGMIRVVRDDLKSRDQLPDME